MTRIVATLGLAGIAIALGHAAPAEGQQSARISWLTDKKKAFDEARRTNKPLWVLFR